MRSYSRYVYVRSQLNVVVWEGDVCMYVLSMCIYLLCDCEWDFVCVTVIVVNVIPFCVFILITDLVAYAVYCVGCLFIIL